MITDHRALHIQDAVQRVTGPLDAAQRMNTGTPNPQPGDAKWSAHLTSHQLTFQQFLQDTATTLRTVWPEELAATTKELDKARLHSLQ